MFFPWIQHLAFSACLLQMSCVAVTWGCWENFVPKVAVAWRSIFAEGLHKFFHFHSYLLRSFFAFVHLSQGNGLILVAFISMPNAYRAGIPMYDVSERIRMYCSLTVHISFLHTFTSLKLTFHPYFFQLSHGLTASFPVHLRCGGGVPQPCRGDPAPLWNTSLGWADSSRSNTGLGPGTVDLQSASCFRVRNSKSEKNL